MSDDDFSERVEMKREEFALPTTTQEILPGSEDRSNSITVAVSAFHEEVTWPGEYSLTPRIVRTPNFGDALLFLAILGVAMLMAACGLGLAIHFHWFGLRDFAQSPKETSVALMTQGIVYAISLGIALPFFQSLWGKNFLAGLHWRGRAAYRLRYWLVAMAVGCDLMAMVANLVLKFPEHAPIDEMFGSTREAWMLAGFGIVVAPLMEEMIFRGFLLPAVATAWDWCGEKLTNSRPTGLDAEGNPSWSVGARVFSALTVSAPFAWIHAEQVGNSWGPLVLLYCVSLVLCTVRLTTRSLAASTLVHSAYNFLLFAAMFAETDGFRHLEKM